MGEKTGIDHREPYLTVAAPPRAIRKTKTITYLNARYVFQDDKTMDRMMSVLTKAHDSRKMLDLTNALKTLKPFKQRLAFDPARKNRHVLLRDRAMELAEEKSKARRKKTNQVENTDQGGTSNGME